MKILRVTSPYILFSSVVLCIALAFSLIRVAAHAGTLSGRSDTLSTSAPSAASNHSIVFTTATLIPASGKIIFTPQATHFTIPGSLDYTDVDLAIDNTDITLAATPGTGGGSAFGVSVTPGTSGNITITLNDTDTIALGSDITLLIGSHTVIGAAGDQQISNPASIGSYNLTLATTTSANAAIDSGSIGIAIVNPVTITGTGLGNVVADPIITPAGGTFSTDVTVTITTATVGADIYYTLDGSIPTALSNLYTTSFTITETTTIKAIGIKAGMDDSSVIASVITINTNSNNVVLPPITYTNSNGAGKIGQDGGTFIHTCANGAKLESLVIPPHNFTDYVFTITCISWSSTAPVAVQNQFGSAPGDTAFSITAQDPSGKIVTKFPQPLVVRFSYPAGQLAPYAQTALVGYNFPAFIPLQAHTMAPIATDYTYSIEYAGVIALLGKEKIEIPCESRPADLNCDGRVNIIDFSILMSHWGNANKPRADINADGKVNLVDLSILLYWWTG